MAVSGASAVNKIPYVLGTDKPPDVPAVTKAMADFLDALKWGSQNLKPTVGVIASSGSQTLGTSYADIAGAVLEITPAVPSKLLVTAIFDFEIITGGVLRTLTGTLNLDTVDQAVTAVYKDTQTGALATIVQVYSLALTAAKHTIKMRAKSDVAENGRVTQNTRALYQLVAS